jgi:hypothetical protein
MKTSIHKDILIATARSNQIAISPKMEYYWQFYEASPDGKILYESDIVCESLQEAVKAFNNHISLNPNAHSKNKFGFIKYDRAEYTREKVETIIKENKAKRATKTVPSQALQNALNAQHPEPADDKVPLSQKTGLKI